ncbi:hypothetical protein GOV09_06475 [Candidatus Woesearchaeota archaeon]|nr:hypothetical protein [Candidatus Woesearchaeota archaeon]
MKKRGQAKTITYIIIAIGLVVLIIFSLSSFQELASQQDDIQIVNLQKSIATRVLQQSTRSKGTRMNASFAVPSSVHQICFFDSNQSFDNLRNPAITSLFADDEVNNLFLLSGGSYIPGRVENMVLRKNPLCAKIINNRIDLVLETSQQQTVVDASADVEDVQCVSVLEHGPNEGKIDIVFLGYAFKDTDEFNEEVNRYMNNILLEFKPFSDYIEKFNFYRVDDTNISCDISGYIACDQYQLLKSASNCPNDYIFLLVARSKIAEFIKPVRSSAIGKIAKINTADKPFVLVHEFGHTFGDLADEYVDDNYYTLSNFDVSKYPNCDSSPCDAWQTINGSSCYQGCSLSRYFRPTEESLMRSLSSPTFGPVNERELLKRLLHYD